MIFFNNLDARTFLARKNIVYSFIIKMLAMVLSFSIVSLSIKYLGVENYGTWVVLSGILAWSQLFDFGLTNGLQNKLGESIAKNNKDDGKYYVSTTYIFLLLASVVLLAFILPLIHYINWQNFLNISSISNSSVRYVLYIITIMVIIQFLLKPINAIVNAYQNTFITQLISLIGLFLSFFAIYTLENSKIESSMINYAYFMAGLPVIALFLSSIYLYSVKFRDLIPSFKNIRYKYLKSLSHLGISFFLIQVSGIVILQTDYIIISNILGPSYVTDYSIVTKYFSIPMIAFSIILSPYWSAFTNAYHQNDIGWIKSTMNKLIKISFLMIFMLMIFIIFSNYVYKLWINESINISISISILVGLFVFFKSFFNIFAFFANGVGKIQIQLYSNVFAAVINIPLSYYLAKYLNLGISGVILATIISISISGIFMIIQYYKIMNKSAFGIWNK